MACGATYAALLTAGVRIFECPPRAVHSKFERNGMETLSSASKLAYAKRTVLSTNLNTKAETTERVERIRP